MRCALVFIAIALLQFCAPRAEAADLTKIERSIQKEPKYTGKPVYCLLVFGAEAKFRVWLVRDGHVLYVDRNGDGDLTGPDKRVATVYRKEKTRFGFNPGMINGPGGAKYNLAQLRQNGDSCDMSIYFEKNGGCVRVGFDGPGPLRFADNPKDAPIIHFHGPLTLMQFEPQPDSVSPDCKPEPLVRGRTSKLAFSLGTPGLGSGTFAKYVIDHRGDASVEVRFAGGKTVRASLAPDD
jgi:hypothetical protein